MKNYTNFSVKKCKSFGYTFSFIFLFVSIYDFLNSKEPYESLFKENPWMIPPNLKKPLEWGENYWNTTVARKHPYWKDFELPVPTKDIHTLRSDLKEWGFGLIEEAPSL